MIYACERIIYSDNYRKNYDSYGHKILNLKIIKYLIEHGADVNVKNKHNTTPLMIACSKKNTPPLFEGDHCFLYDSEILNIEVVKYLIEHGADINAKNINNNTPLILACCYCEDIELIIYLLMHGAEVNAITKTGETPLLITSQLNNRNKKTIIRYLIAFGADVNAINNEGYTTLMNICMSRDNMYEILKCLIDLGVDVNAKNNEMETATMIALRNMYVGSDFLTYLIEQEICSNKDNTFLGTYLLNAVQMENPKWEIINYLIEKGADVNTMDSQKCIPLHYVCGKRFIEDLFFNDVLVRENEAIEVIHKLLNHGSSVNAKK